MSDKRRKNSYSGNHQRSWLWGHHAVCETLQSGAWPILAIYATQSAFDQYRELLKRVNDGGASLEMVSSARIEELSQARDHQGLLVRLGAYSYRSMEQFSSDLAGPRGNDRTMQRKLVVLCDRIQDTFNFGAILRCCDGANADGVVVGRVGQAEVTPHVIRSSSGAANHVPIYQTENLIDSIHELKRHGFQVIAADANGAESMWKSDLSRDTLLIIGSEAHGVAPDLLALSDQRIQIPMLGKVTSLNAAVASGILLYEIRRQQQLA